MATPNIVNVATINAKNAMGALANTSRTTMIDVPAEKIMASASVRSLASKIPASALFRKASASPIPNGSHPL